ncbi:MAG: serine hydrolase domain-containing protein, partial [Bacteroidota bacterium]
FITLNNRDMRKILFLSFGLLLAIMSCQQEHKPTFAEESIRKIESSLSPKILLSGEGFDAELWDIRERMEFYNIPAVSIAFFEEGQVKWSRTYGTLSKSDSTKINTQTIFQAASISKPVTAVGVLKLVDHGKLELDIPVNNYLIGWKIRDNKYTQNRPVTIRDLLSHTSGMTVTGFDGYRAGDSIPTLIEILDGTSPANSKPVEVDTVPGSIFRYSGGAYTILQKLIEDLTALPFKDYMTENVLNPLGMENSFFEQPMPKMFAQNAAIGHSGNGEMITGQYHTYPELAAAGLWTNPNDLAKFAISVQEAYQGSDQAILSQNLASEFLKDHMDNWGLGIILIEGDSSKWFTHGGANLGYRCTMLSRIEDGQGVAIMTNGNRGAGLYNEILRSFSITYGWDIFQPEIKTVIKMPKEELELCIGKYGHLPENKYQVDVKVQGDFLEITQLWNNIKIPVYSKDQYSFFEGEEGVSFDFKPHENGSIEALVINGDWVLTKLE